MDQFNVFLSLGWSHILDFQAYDHLVFIMGLCLPFSFQQWKPLLLLVTGFTLGHSASLVIAVLNYYKPNSAYIEFLIPLTIAITALSHLIWPATEPTKKVKSGGFAFMYGSVSFFGLIHGFGFSGYLSSLIGKEADVFIPLAAFNIGIELAQLLLVLIMLTFHQIIFTFFRPRRHSFRQVSSGIIIGIALVLMMNNWPF